MVSETFVSGFDLCTIFLPFHSSNVKKEKGFNKNSVYAFYLSFDFFLFFRYIYIFCYVHLVAMIRIKSDMLEKIFRVLKNVKRDVMNFLLERM